MKKKHNGFIIDTKGRNIASNVMITAGIICGIIPVFIVVEMLGLLAKNEMTLHRITVYGGMIAGCLTFKALFHGLSIWMVHCTAYEVLTDIRMKMIGHLKQMPLSFFQKRKTGDLTNIINRDVEQVELYLAHALPEIMSATLIPAICFVAVMCLDWRLGLGLVSTVPLMFLLRKLLDRLWAGTIMQYMKSTRKMSEDLLEYIAAIPVIKAFSREECKTRDVLDGMRAYIHWVKQWVLSLTFPMCFITMMLEGGLVVMVVIGTSLLSQGRIDIHTFVLSFILGGIFSTSFAQLATYQHYKIVYNRSLQSIGSVMNAAPREKKSGRPDIRGKDVVLTNLSFSYDGKENVLSRVNLVFKENSVNAVVGGSGSGKSTIANLIMGFRQPDSGGVSIGGTDISVMDDAVLSNLVSIVQQDVFLFNLSIEENIRIGNQNATREEIVEAAGKAQIHDLIQSLPMGYETPAGEAGVKLSGGEKQRIAIARMILKDTPIIILDEATAAVDPANEHLIQKAIGHLGKNKTVITIAHHLNTISNADQIIVMAAGNVAATGKHRELLANCPLYAEMIRCQQKVDNWQLREVPA